VSIQTLLFYLDLSRNGLADVGLLGGLASLAYLHLARNDLTTVGSLRGLYEAGTLEHLSLGGNSRFDCSSLDLGGTSLLEAADADATSDGSSTARTEKLRKSSVSRA